MFVLKKTMEISAAHKLSLLYESKCKELHGHNWKIVVWCHCADEELGEDGAGEGMVIDFTEIKKIVSQLDHKNLNDFFPQPTAENIAYYIGHKIPYCSRVDVEETEGNVVSWIDDRCLSNAGIFR